MTRYIRRENAPRLERLNLVQARLNDGERELMDDLRRLTGMSDSALLRAGLKQLAAGSEQGRRGEP